MIKNSLRTFAAKAGLLILFTSRSKGHGNVLYSHDVYVVDLRLNIILALATLCLVNNLEYKQEIYKRN